MDVSDDPLLFLKVLWLGVAVEHGSAKTRRQLHQASVINTRTRDILQSFDIGCHSRDSVDAVNEPVFLNECRTLGQDLRNVITICKVQLVYVPSENSTSFCYTNFLASEIYSIRIAAANYTTHTTHVLSIVVLSTICLILTWKT